MRRGFSLSHAIKREIVPIDRRESNLSQVSGDVFLDESETEAEVVDLAPRRPSALAYGTAVQAEWDDRWIDLVRMVEKDQGHAICGSKRTETDIDSMLRTGKVSEEELDLEVVWVCSLKAGLETAHPGQGRCYRHGGNSAPSAPFAMITRPDLSARVHDYFEREDLLDLRGAVAMLWLANDAITSRLDEGEPLSVSDAKEIGALMSRIGNLVKQHNEIMEKRKILIEVPEFIAWAEHFYELAIKYILEGSKDTKGFLREAQSYYDATVTIKVGLDTTPDGNRGGHPFSGDSSQPVLGPGEPDS